MNKQVLKNQDGFSLMENLLYLGIIGIVLSIFMSLTINTMRSATVVLNAKEVQQSSRFILSRIDQEIKTAQEILSVTSDKITFLNVSGNNAYIQWASSTKAIYYDDGSETYKISNENIKVNNLIFSSIGNIIKTDITLEKDYSLYGTDTKYEISMSNLVTPRRKLY